MGGMLDAIANYNPSGFALENQQRAANIPATQANTALVQQQTAGLAQEQAIRQRQLQDQGIISRAYLNTTGHPEEVRQYLIKNGISGGGYMAWQEHAYDMATKAAQLSKDQREAEVSLHNQAGDIIDTLNGIGDPAQQQAIYAQELPRLQQLAPDVQWKDPAQLSGSDLKLYSGILGHAKTVLEQTKTQAEIEAQKAQAAASAATQQKTMAELPGITAEGQIKQAQAAMGLMGNSEYDQFLLAYAKNMGKTPATLTPEERLQSFSAFAVTKQDPQMREMALAQKNVALSLQQMQLANMPTQEQAHDVASDIINHRIAPEQLASMFGGFGVQGQTFKRMVYTEAKKLDPNFNYEQASSEYALSKSPGFQQTVRYMDYVGTSVDRVIDAADKLANIKIRSINAVKNWTAKQLNGVDIARFNANRLEVSDAIAKILQGGGTGSNTSDMKLTQAQELIKDTDSPDVVRTTLGEIKGLIANRRNTLTKGTWMESATPAQAKAAPTEAVEHWVRDATGKLVKQ